MKDLFGVACSSLCIIHCALTPILLVFGVSSLGLALLESEWVHLVLAVLMFVLAALSFPKGYKIHQHVMPLVFGGVGVLLMLGSLIAGEALEAYFAVSAGLALILGHAINRHFLKTQRLQSVRG